MDLQAKAVASAMEESCPAAILLFGRVAGIRKKLLHSFVHTLAFDLRFHELQSELLAFQHGFPELPLRIAGLTANNGTRHVSEVPGVSVPRENVQDDERIRLQRPAAAFMRIASLFAA